MYIPKSEYYELPTKYNKTIIRLLVQSPTRMFVYWDISDETVNRFKSQNIDYNNCTPILKIKNITMNYSYDIPVDPFTNNYYIEVKDPDCEYQVELGRKNKNQFINIYTSNSAKIPRNTPVYTKDSEQVIFRNYIKLDISDKFTVYYRRNTYNIDGSSPQDYTKLPVSNGEQVRIINEGSFTRYENAGSSMENISSFGRYENESSFTWYEN